MNKIAKIKINGQPKSIRKRKLLARRMKANNEVSCVSARADVSSSPRVRVYAVYRQSIQ